MVDGHLIFSNAARWLGKGASYWGRSMIMEDSKGRAIPFQELWESKGEHMGLKARRTRLEGAIALQCKSYPEYREAMRRFHEITQPVFQKPAGQIDTYEEAVIMLRYATGFEVAQHHLKDKKHG